MSSAYFSVHQHGDDDIRAEAHSHEAGNRPRAWVNVRIGDAEVSFQLADPGEIVKLGERIAAEGRKLVQARAEEAAKEPDPFNPRPEAVAYAKEVLAIIEGPPERAVAFAEPVAGSEGGYLVTLDCGHKLATRNKQASYPCRACLPDQPAVLAPPLDDDARETLEEMRAEESCGECAGEDPDCPYCLGKRPAEAPAF